jgi:hypothetical protein
MLRNLGWALIMFFTYISFTTKRWIYMPIVLLLYLAIPYIFSSSPPGIAFTLILVLLYSVAAYFIKIKNIKLAIISFTPMICYFALTFIGTILQIKALNNFMDSLY